MKKSLWLISVGAIALGSSVPVAWAQDSGSAVDSENVNIIVTATRRASPLSDVPIAVSAVTSQAMQNSGATRSEDHTYELQSLMRISYDVFCLKTTRHKYTYST